MEWSRDEVQHIVTDYLQMLMAELSGQHYSKAEHRRRLKSFLPQRNDSAIEFKHGNISAVMVRLGYPYIRGYQPRQNVQSLLVDVVAAAVRQFSLLDKVALAAVEQPAVSPLRSDFTDILASPPVKDIRIEDKESPAYRVGIQRDYLERETQNQSLGLAGEEFILRYEHWRLVKEGKPRLADRIEHVSRTKGDGLGYDIHSFDTTGRDRFIEVKTTSFGVKTPFYVTQGELRFSRDAKDQFQLYRLFEFRKSARMFQLRGPVDQHCALDPLVYRASFN